MAVKKSVFSSDSEKQGFESIEHTWGDEYRVLPQFPFSALFDPDDTVKNEGDFFYKTSIDYVLCTKWGKPLLAIDFDGLGKGFSNMDFDLASFRPSVQYIEVEKTNDENRKVKFDFKLRYAMKNFFPYYVVASDEFQELDRDINLTIVDALIGRELYKGDIRHRIQSAVDGRSDAIAKLNPSQQEEYIQRLILVEEIESELENDAVILKTAEIEQRIDAMGGLRGAHRVDWLSEDEFPNQSHEAGSSSSGVKRVGCKYSLHETSVGDVSATAWMRNLGDDWIVHNIAQLLVSTKLLRLLKKTPKNRWVAVGPRERILTDGERIRFLDPTQGQSYNEKSQR